MSTRSLFWVPLVAVLKWTGTWWSGVDNKKVKEREREREADIPWFTQKPKKVPDTGLVSLTKASGALSRG